MSAAATILVVGFGPFPRVPRNPSGVLALRIAASRRFPLRDCTARALVLPTAYGAIETVLRPFVREERPDAILLIGVAARRRALCVETRALNRASRLFPDASGSVGQTLALAPERPLVLRSRAPVQDLVQRLRAAGLAARASIDAGRYLCNAAYFAMLDEAGPDGPPVVFIHVPMPAGRTPGDRRPTLSAMERGLTGAALVLAARAARRSDR